MTKRIKRITGRSMAPVGRTTPHYKARLTYKGRPDPERILIELWARENVPKESLNFGFIPLDYILHTCTQQCQEVNGVMRHAYQNTYSRREIEIASATVQWLGTNCGRGLLSEFFRLLDEAHQKAREERRARFFARHPQQKARGSLAAL